LNDSLVELVADSFERVSSTDYLRQLEHLQECLAELPQRDHQLLELRYSRDLKPAAMGQILDMNPNTVSKALQRIRDQLRICLERRTAAEGPL
jgi:RNA polymerase sigma-70 factor (ECF subfamily)